MKRGRKSPSTPWKASGEEGRRIFPLHLGQDPMFGLMVPLPKKGLQIMLILKMFLLAIKWLQVYLHWSHVLNLHNLLKMNDSWYVCYGAGNAFRKDQRGEEHSAASWSTPARKLRKRHADFFGITQILLPGRDIGVIVSIELLAASFAAMVSSLKCLLLLSQGSLWIQVIPETNVKQIYLFRVQMLCAVSSQCKI